MQSNGTYTVWIGDRRFAISAEEIQNLRSSGSKVISGFSDAELVAALARGRFVKPEHFTGGSRVDVLNARELRLLQEAHATVRSGDGSACPD